MAGGVANIWGCLIDDTASYDYSLPYSNKHQIKTWSVFFNDHKRFLSDMRASNTISSGCELTDQEMENRNRPGMTYWEGSVTVNGTKAGGPVDGCGYVELTGYAEPFDAPM